jgi:DNA-directed RNA polymerase specialized sigma subunit
VIVVDKETFRVTERKIYNYFKKDRVINTLKHKANILKKQVDQIEEKLRTTDISIPEESRAQTYEERVQTSSNGESYAERTLMNIVEKRIMELDRKKKEIADIEEQIRDIEADSVIIGDNIKGLHKYFYEPLRLKYDKELPDWRIGIELHISRSQVSRRKDKAIQKVAEWEAWNPKK